MFNIARSIKGQLGGDKVVAQKLRAVECHTVVGGPACSIRSCRWQDQINVGHISRIRPGILERQCQFDVLITQLNGKQQRIDRHFGYAVKNDPVLEKLEVGNVGL